MGNSGLGSIFGGGGARPDPAALLEMLAQLGKLRGSAPQASTSEVAEQAKKIVRICLADDARGMAARSAWRKIGEGVRDLLRVLAEEQHEQPRP